MNRLNMEQTQFLGDAYDQAMALTPGEKTSYHLVLKEETTGFELPYGALTQHELKQVSNVLEPHQFFSGHEWCTSTQKTESMNLTKEDLQLIYLLLHKVPVSYTMTSGMEYEVLDLIEKVGKEIDDRMLKGE